MCYPFSGLLFWYGWQYLMQWFNWHPLDGHPRIPTHSCKPQLCITYIHACIHAYMVYLFILSCLNSPRPTLPYPTHPIWSDLSTVLSIYVYRISKMHKYISTYTYPHVPTLNEWLLGPSAGPCCKSLRSSCGDATGSHFMGISTGPNVDRKVGTLENIEESSVTLS